MDQAVRPGGRRTVRLFGWLAELEWRRDVALPAILLAAQLAGAAATVAGHHGQRAHLGALGWILLVVGPAALVFRRRWPVAVLWVAFAATVTPSGSAAWPAYFSLIAAFFLAATGGHRRAAWVVIVVGYVSAVWLAPLAHGNPASSLEFALLLLGWLAVLVIVAEVVRLRRERTVQIRAARQVDQRRRASEERLRIARDLHDVMGHNISLINVQASAGLDLMDTQPEQARAALAAIKTVSKDALDELRGLLSVLRQADDEDAPRAPAPGLDRLPDLIELTRAAGLTVRSEIVGPPRPLSATVELAAYRIIQESLTNVARHAGPASVTVRLTYRPDRLDIEVSNDGRASPPGSAHRAGTGNGIAGMRERAVALGGQLDAGPRPGGGFDVTVHLPLGPQP